MKILVTGATGFIGNYVVEELIFRKYQVIATSTSISKARTFHWFDNVTYIPLDFEKFDNAKDYFTFFGSPDIVIHLAWEGLPDYKETFHEEVNLPRHFAFLQNLVLNGLDDLTVIGTCFEYGMYEGKLSEEMEVHPANSYGRAKNNLRMKLEELRSRKGFSLKWVRLFYMYGKGQNPKSLLSQLDKALDNNEAVFNMSGGEQIRDFLPVNTVAQNIVAIALQRKVEGIINNCSGEPITVKNFVENYLNTNKKKIHLNLGFYPYPDYEPMRFWGDAKKIKSIKAND